MNKKWLLLVILILFPTVWMTGCTVPATAVTDAPSAHLCTTTAADKEEIASVMERLGVKKDDPQPPVLVNGEEFPTPKNVTRLNTGDVVSLANGLNCEGTYNKARIVYFDTGIITANAGRWSDASGFQTPIDSQRIDYLAESVYNKVVEVYGYDQSEIAKNAVKTVFKYSAADGTTDCRFTDSLNAAVEEIKRLDLPSVKSLAIGLLPKPNEGTFQALCQ